MADIIGFLKRILGCKEQEMQTKIDEMLRIQLEMSRKLESMQPSKEETYYNTKYPSQTIYYNARNFAGSEDFGIDVRNFFVNPSIDELGKIVAGIPGTDDEKAIAIQKWIKSNITYISDKAQAGISEFWMLPMETLHTRKGDCEDGAILMANLMVAAGIPYWKVRINAGDVYDEKGNHLGGHCWTNYYCQETARWIVMDWCFYPKIDPLNKREEYKDDILYGKGNVWFSFNQRYAFAKSTADIAKMENVKNARKRRRKN